MKINCLCFTVVYFIKLLAGLCAYAHQQWCAVRFSTSVHVILAERKLRILIFVQSLSPLHEAAESADFPKLDPDPVGVAEGVTKIKVAYNQVYS